MQNTVNIEGIFSYAGPGRVDRIVSAIAGDGDVTDMWASRARALLTAQVSALCALEGAGEIKLDLATFRDFLKFGPADLDGHGRSTVDLYLRACNGEFSKDTHLLFKGFFDSLPGFCMGHARNARDQAPKCNEQFHYVSMQINAWISERIQHA